MTEDVSASLVSVLKSFGFRTDQAVSGKDALKILENNRDSENPFGLIIMDWRMPEMDGIEASRCIRNELMLKTPILMITAYGREVVKMRAEKTGINGFLNKPINAPSLYYAILVDIFGKDLKGRRGFKRSFGELPSPPQNLAGLRLLVVEDNPTNQEIIIEILKRAQIDVTLVNTGKKAVDAVMTFRFDAVLMDIQTPEMDGYEATRQIRSLLSEPPAERLPIIAMAAHAMKGDREKCLDAGMDAHLTKPIIQDQLFRTLTEFCPESPQRPHTVLDAPQISKSSDPKAPWNKIPGIDFYRAMKDLELDEVTFHKILKGFHQNSMDTLKTIRKAFRKKRLADP